MVLDDINKNFNLYTPVRFAVQSILSIDISIMRLVVQYIAMPVTCLQAKAGDTRRK